ncbi:MAG: Asp-tRNA(Asn)/Glu-tRNA(Gln) amidotransferase subunit GatB [Nanoarchaeota archaeon]|nr:Asp-tRNA(Asn)/Glu-tRNA(Gln) amidotransferase subunit GatB [Nanoarchaeota archaeon]
MVKVGLEIHGYILTEEKLFCPCKALHGTKQAKPNTNICPICTAQPGAKPMLPNKEAIKKAIEIALLLNCKINSELVWQRKHYDWPDLPKGYQNTISGAHATPLGEKGEFLGIRIREVHLEEDPAAWNPKTGEIDYNRSGSPLIEIVTEPDFNSSERVVEWLRQLVITLGYIKAFDKNSGIKADVNVSLPELKGERIEVKNVNSLKNIQKAIEYETQRQKKPGELAKKQETRMFDEALGITKKMREKEQAQDYRFIHEPDLPIIKLEKSRIQKIKSSIPETPLQKLEKIIKKHKIDKKSAEVLTKKLEIVEFFEKVAEKANPKLALPWVTVELLSVLNYNKKEIEDVDISPEKFIELLKKIENKTITPLYAKDILRSWVKPSNKLPLKQQKMISNKNELEDICKKILGENPKAISDYKAGKKESLNFLVGKVMQATNKRADFRTAKDLLEKLLR